MAIRSYSLRRHDGILLSDHFRVREFRCRDGSDTILIDDRLIRLLEQIRVWAGNAVTVTSAYRTDSHNRRVGGAADSYHVRGQAADIVVAGKTPEAVAKFAQALGAHGVGLYTAQKFVHVDTRTGNYYWKNSGSGDRKVSGHGGACPYACPSSTLRKGSKGSSVRWLQWWLRLWGYGISVDGVFGTKTEAALKEFQERMSLERDGIAGTLTLRALREVLV